MKAEMEEKLAYISAHDPDGSERLKRLAERSGLLLDKNVYGEHFTQRQFDLVFNPLLEAALNRAKILEALGQREGTVAALSEKLGLEAAAIFNCMKDLLRRNQVEIIGFEERHPIFRKR